MLVAVYKPEKLKLRCKNCGCEFHYFDIQDTLVIRRCSKCGGIVFEEVEE